MLKQNLRRRTKAIDGKVKEMSGYPEYMQGSLELLRKQDTTESIRHIQP
jgi:hypothetical protein